MMGLAQADAKGYRRRASHCLGSRVALCFAVIGMRIDVHQWGLGVCTCCKARALMTLARAAACASIRHGERSGGRLIKDTQRAIANESAQSRLAPLRLMYRATRTVCLPSFCIVARHRIRLCCQSHELAPSMLRQRVDADPIDIESGVIDDIVYGPTATQRVIDHNEVRSRHIIRRI